MLLKLGGGAGSGVETDATPKIAYNGKWSGWHVEFYADEPYWEAIFYTSGALAVTDEYMCDIWKVGGGAYSQSGVCGNGAVAMAAGLSLAAGNYAITIGAGGSPRNDNTKPGGTTSSTIPGDAIAAGGQPGVTNTGAYYRFGDAGHAEEEGADGDASFGSHGVKGWLHWRCDSAYSGDGTGYGAGGVFSGQYNPRVCGHPGALVIRIPVE